jgi:hypothetical protein
MKVLLALLMICFVPFLAEAKEPQLTYDKETVLKLAHKHFDDSIVALKNADRICWYIPDLSQRKHFKALITGAISSATVQKPREKILVTGISIIASVMEEVQDKYLEIVHWLREADYHFEMVKFYNDLSRKSHLPSNTNQGTLFFFYGIDQLTAAISIVDAIHPDFEREYVLIYALIQYRKGFIENQTKLCDRSWGLYEGFPEMACDIRSDYRITIQKRLLQMHEEFLKAEQAWAKERHEKKKKHS